MTISQPRLMDVLQLWMAEKTTELVGVLDVDKLDPETKLAVRAMQSVNLKLTQAKANPIWDPVTLAGTIVENAAAPGSFTLDTPDGSVSVKDAGESKVSAVLAGRPVVFTGYIKTAGQIEPIKVIERHVNTLELVVMSQCPYGAKAVDAVAEHLKAATAGQAPPRLDVRYLFYRKEELLREVAGPVITLQPSPAGGGAGAAGTSSAAPAIPSTPATKVTWWSLHGEPEIVENLVQMVIRDRYADRFFGYVQKRAHSTKPWRELAAEAGLLPGEIELVNAAITLERESLIAAEYDYVKNTLGLTDGSPTFVWESQLAKDITRIPAFKTLDLNKGSCGGQH